MKKILFLSKGINASSTRYRALQYFDYFSAQDYEPSHFTISGGLFAFLKAIFLAREADIVVLLRKTFPKPLFWILRRSCKKLVFDFDDAIFCNTNGTYSKTRYARFIATIRSCDLVLAGNRYLHDEAIPYNKNVFVIPTSLKVSKYEVSIPKDSHQFSLVWIGSQPAKKYIQGILPAIENAAQHIPQLSLKIIADFKLKSEKVKITNIDWSEFTEAEEISRCHVGLGPLPADNWTKGKCGLKNLQYMAASLPVICTPTSINAEVVMDGVSGYHANSNEAWSVLIIKAYSRKDTLANMGKIGNKTARQNYDIVMVFDKLIHALKSLD